jgi:hypothetical protein
MSYVHPCTFRASQRPEELSRFAIVAQRPFDRYYLKDQKDYFLIPGDAVSLSLGKVLQLLDLLRK